MHDNYDIYSIDVIAVLKKSEYIIILLCINYANEYTLVDDHLIEGPSLPETFTRRNTSFHPWV